MLTDLFYQDIRPSYEDGHYHRLNGWHGTPIIGLMALAALILGLIWFVSPHATVIANEVSGETYGIDILGLTKQAKDLPEQRYAEF